MSDLALFLCTDVFLAIFKLSGKMPASIHHENSWDIIGETRGAIIIRTVDFISHKPPSLLIF